ncbi:hypothetical protein GCM10027160_44180 [Streptomyces calidiresistens]|uniref:Uncharacterized protein n=1 Tax=Streptomyces calidiresistens TaxID=1485586 RepID=A0A7W3XX88_9ACTN|nr:hypothetical protein [Streptomyces calidiresistens]MBB0230541.1 hypothetical protein [Streptomyces calidiresistens]
MTETLTHTTRVSDARGPVNTGSGDQYISYTVITEALKDSRGKSPRRVLEDELRELRRRFVPPRGTGEARELLTRRRMILLDADPGTGRSATARVLLSERRRTNDTIHHLPLPGEEGGRFPDPEQIDRHGCLLLDVSEAAPGTWATVRPELPALLGIVRDRSAYLVVIPPSTATAGEEVELNPYRVALTRPSNEQVIRAHLRAEDITPFDTEGVWPEFPNAVLDTSRPMRELARFVHLIARARNSPEAGSTFEQWCAGAAEVLTDQADEVARLAADAGNGPDRGLLLVASLLHGSPTDVVHRATTALLRVTGQPATDLPLLEQADLAQRLKEVGALIDPAGRVRFEKLDRDRAVRAHFWNARPDLRQPLRTWLDDLVTDPDHGVGGESLRHAVERLVSEHLRTGHGDEVAQLVRRWGRGRFTRARLDSASRALLLGLRAEGSREFRKAVREWAQSETLPRWFRDLLVEVCTGVIAFTHPHQALVRLHHLARWETGDHRARDALRDLVRRQPDLRDHLLGRLVRPDHPKADTSLFLHLADPVSLITSAPGESLPVERRVVRERLVIGWSRAFEHAPIGLLSAAIGHWLNVAAHHDKHTEALLAIPVEGAMARPDRPGLLYGIARARAHRVPGGPERGTEILTALREAISAARSRSSEAVPPRRPTEENPS